MLIISQDETVIIDSKNVFAFYIDKSYKHTRTSDEPIYIIKAHGNFKGSFPLGEFTTKAEAKTTLSNLLVALEDNTNTLYYMS